MRCDQADRRRISGAIGRPRRYRGQPPQAWHRGTGPQTTRSACCAALVSGWTRWSGTRLSDPVRPGLCRIQSHLCRLFPARTGGGTHHDRGHHPLTRRAAGGGGWPPGCPCPHVPRRVPARIDQPPSAKPRHGGHGSCRRAGDVRRRGSAPIPSPSNGAALERIPIVRMQSSRRLVGHAHLQQRGSQSRINECDGLVKAPRIRC